MIRYGRSIAFQLEHTDPSDIGIRHENQQYRVAQMDEISRPPVKSKRDFYRRFHKGEFGNRFRTWSSLEEYLDSGFSGLVGIRTMRSAGGPGPFIVNLKRSQAIKKARQLKGESISISEMCPHEHNRLLGEICQLQNGTLHLRASKKRNLRMRESVLPENSRDYFGYEALSVVRNYTTETDFSWIEFLLESYANHVIEFTSLGVPAGVIPGSHCVIWEVRNY